MFELWTQYFKALSDGYDEKANHILEQILYCRDEELN